LPLGRIEVPTADENDLVTVVVRLTSGGSDEDGRYLLADAVKLEEID
jgi:hypothetical protein